MSTDKLQREQLEEQATTTVETPLREEEPVNENAGTSGEAGASGEAGESRPADATPIEEAPSATADTTASEAAPTAEPASKSASEPDGALDSDQELMSASTPALPEEFEEAAAYTAAVAAAREQRNNEAARAAHTSADGEPTAGIVTVTRNMMPVSAPGRNQMPVDNRPGAETSSGATHNLAWGARSDVGLVRGHNEDAFLVQAPLFVVCDGMGGHAAGEVASHIAVEAIARRAPEHADEILLGAAVEAANEEVLEGALTGKGKPGMGCTASCVLIENNHMSIAHVGDSRVYLLHGGTLVRITHDHSYVEELVDAGEITADEARVHPSRSIITRALGSDPDMYADHFTLDVSSGDRIIVCSDGLSSMVPDKEIEELAVSSVTPQAAADTLVSAALTAGGHDNVTVVVVDVVDDGLGELHRAERRRSILIWAAITLAAIVLAAGVMVAVVRNSWYVGNNDGTVAVYRGINDELFGVPLYQIEETSNVQVRDLPEALQRQLDEGIGVANMDEGCNTVEDYRDQIDTAKTIAAETAGAAQSSAGVGKQGSLGAAVETGDSIPPAAAQTGEQAANDASQAARQEATSGVVGQEGE